MRYRMSIAYYLWDEESYTFTCNEFMYPDKPISKTVPLKMAKLEVAFVSGTLEDYLWPDRVI